MMPEKNNNRFRILRILEMFDVCWTNFKNNQILLDKICNRFLLKTKLFKAHLHVQFQRQISH